MEISAKCIAEWYNFFKEHNKCNQRVTAYSIALAGQLITATLICVCVLTEVLFEMYNFADNNLIFFYLALVSLIHMFVTCVLLVYGIRKNQSWCVLTWIITMIIYWHLNLTASVISLVNFVISDKGVVDKNSRRTLVLFFVQAVWLIMIVFMWNYWKDIKECNNVANIVEYVIERRNSFLGRRQENEIEQGVPAAV